LYCESPLPPILQLAGKSSPCPSIQITVFDTRSLPAVTGGRLCVQCPATQLPRDWHTAHRPLPPSRSVDSIFGPEDGVEGVILTRPPSAFCLALAQPASQLFLLGLTLHPSPISPSCPPHSPSLSSLIAPTS